MFEIQTRINEMFLAIDVTHQGHTTTHMKNNKTAFGSMTCKLVKRYKTNINQLFQKHDIELELLYCMYILNK